MMLQMNKNDPSNPHGPTSVLDLVVAWELPITLVLEDHQRDVIDAALTELDNELAANEPRAAALAQILEHLPEPDVLEHQITETRSSLNSDEVEQYDHYFDVRHVDTASPALSLVRSLLITCHAFLVLRETGRKFDPLQIESQTAGFREHANLIRRICRLERAD